MLLCSLPFSALTFVHVSGYVSAKNRKRIAFEAILFSSMQAPNMPLAIPITMVDKSTVQVLSVPQCVVCKILTSAEQCNADFVFFRVSADTEPLIEIKAPPTLATNASIQVRALRTLTSHKT